jgi:hypothetical protein
MGSGFTGASYPVERSRPRALEPKPLDGYRTHIKSPADAIPSDSGLTVATFALPTKWNWPFPKLTAFRNPEIPEVPRQHFLSALIHLRPLRQSLLPSIRSPYLFRHHASHTDHHPLPGLSNFRHGRR